jgi:hypothetical protein
MFLPANQDNFAKKIRRAHEPKIAKSLEDILKSKGNFNSSENLEKYNKFIKTLLKSDNNFLVQDVFLSIASTMLDSVLNNSSKGLPIAHQNMMIPNTENHITKVIIGETPNRKLRAIINGPKHQVFDKLLVETKSDFLASEPKKTLTSYSGVNQRNFTFFGESTYLSVKDTCILTNYEEKRNIVDKEFERVKKINTEITEASKSKSPNQVKRLKHNKKNLRVQKFYAAILSQKRVLTFFNQMPIYDVTVKLHLVRFIDLHYIEAIDKLIETMKQGDAWADGIPLESIKQGPEPSSFSHQLVTTMDVDLEEIECFHRRCKIVKTWSRTLKSGASWQFELEERFRNGVYINKLHLVNGETFNPLVNGGINGPIGYFYIAEYIGDKRATVKRLKDNANFTRVYSPVKIGYDFRMSVKHVAKSNDPDDIAWYQTIKDDKEFLDESLRNDFYPEREEYLNINFDNINLGDDINKKAEFKLELSPSITQADDFSKLEKIVKTVTTAANKFTASFTDDDKPFLDSLKETKGYNNTETQSGGLRGSGNQSYVEDSEDDL